MKSENITRKIDSLGRITLPKGLRDRLKVAEGDEYEILTQDNMICLRPVGSENLKDEIFRIIKENNSKDTIFKKIMECINNDSNL